MGREPEDRDDWRHLEISSEKELVSLFAEHFYFGCEADDRTVAFAFSKANPQGARLRPVFSSDLSHWDVTDMSDVVAEAHELVEGGVIDDADFTDFVWRNPLRLLTGVRPDFFEGTAVESAARAELGTDPR